MVRVRRMAAGLILMLAVPALLAGCMSLQPSPPRSQQPLPRTAKGDPDLQGTWTMRTLTPFFRPDGVSVPSVGPDAEADMLSIIMEQRLAAEALDPGTSDPDGDRLAEVDGQLRTSAIVQPADGRMLLTAAGRARLAARADQNDGPEGRPVNERCIADAGRAPYRVMSGEMYFQIVQTPDALVISKEGMDPPRIFDLAQLQTTPQQGLWSGASQGRWHGDAFVIATSGFRRDDTNRRISGPGAAGFPIAPSTLITEWLIPVSADLILYRYRVEDPELYVEPLVVELPLARTRDRSFESACHEGNISLYNTLQAGARSGVPPRQP